MKVVDPARVKRPLLLIAAALSAITISFAQQSSVPNAPSTAAVDRSRLPQALVNAQLEHLSSGALMLLDHGGDLVRPSRNFFQTSPSIPSQQTFSVTLDPRVGPNTRVGNDPSQLPPGMTAQAEPHVARSPLNSTFVVATFQEGRYADGGAVDCGYSITTDGGVNWTRALIPNVTKTVGGPYFRDTDPVAGVDQNGTVFLTTEGATDSNFNGGAVILSRSFDGGQTFGSPTLVYRPASSAIFPDKPWMAINNFSGTPTVERVIVTFTAFSNTSAAGGVIARAYSDDHGATFSSVALVGSSASNAQGSQDVFLPNGNLVIIYWSFGTSAHPGEHLEAVISTDGGVTFGSAKLITAHSTEYNEPEIRTGSFLPSAVADPTHGNIFVVYQTSIAGNPKIVFTKSVDGGNSWSAPVAISDNPAGDGVFNPAINVSADGQVLSCVFYDHRANPGSRTLVDLYYAQSFDGGATWQPNIRVTDVSTDASLAPLTSTGYMLGDYQGIAQATNSNVPAIPVWIDTRTGDPDPFVAQIQAVPSGSPTPSPTATPTGTATPTPTATPTSTPTPSATPTATPTPTPTPSPGAAVLVNPAPGSRFSSSTVTFQWTKGSATQYVLTLGSQPKGFDLYNSGPMTTLSTTATNIPTDGRTVYATLYSKINSSWVNNAYTYTAANGSGSPTPTPTPTIAPTPTPTPTPTPSSGAGVIVSPVPGSTFGSSTVTFQWTGSATAYVLTVGSSPGGTDIYVSSVLHALSQTVTNIPTDGRTIYVRLYSQVNGSWTFNSYTYTAFK